MAKGKVARQSASILPSRLAHGLEQVAEGAVQIVAELGHVLEVDPAGAVKIRASAIQADQTEWC